MPEYLAPGVFVEETSFRQKTIEGVGTSTAAFVGPTRFGPIDGIPEMLTSFGDFERIYAGIDRLNGGAGRQLRGPRRPGVLRERRPPLLRRPGAAQRRRRRRGLRPGDDPRRRVRSRPAAGAARPPPGPGRQLPGPARPADGPQHPRPRRRPPTLRGGPLWSTRWSCSTGSRGRRRRAHRAVRPAAPTSSTTRPRSGPSTCAARPPTTSTPTATAPSGTVSQLTADTTDVRVLNVDVEAGPLGEFMDPLFYGGPRAARRGPQLHAAGLRADGRRQPRDRARRAARRRRPRTSPTAPRWPGCWCWSPARPRASPGRRGRHPQRGRRRHRRDHGRRPAPPSTSRSTRPAPRSAPRSASPGPS